MTLSEQNSADWRLLLTARGEWGAQLLLEAVTARRIIGQYDLADCPRF